MPPQFNVWFLNTASLVFFSDEILSLVVFCSNAGHCIFRVMISWLSIAGQDLCLFGLNFFFCLQ